MTLDLGEQVDLGLDPYDARVALRADGLLRDFNRAGVLATADVHVARRLGRLGHDHDERVLLAAALAVRAVRLGAVCVQLAEAAETVVPDDGSRLDDAELAWPAVDAWLAACAASPLVAVGGADDGASRPLRLVDGLLYLDRYWRDEELVRTELDERAARPSTVDVAALRAALASVFSSAEDSDGSQRQRLAAAMTGLRSVTVLSGGPGTGKTTTVARLLAMLRALPGGPPRVALAAPTGKAAARMQEAIEEAAHKWDLDVGDARASTLHRLLGRRPDSRSRFRYDRHNRLPVDVVIVDETSMVSLSMMARLLEAVRPEARLVLVGDPDQLASVEAGAVLGDLVHRPAAASASVPAALADLVPDMAADELATDRLRNGVVQLTTLHRFGHAIGALAAAVQAADPDEVLRLLRGSGPEIEFVEVDAERATGEPAGLRTDVVSAARRLVDAASSGDAADALGQLDSHRLLCAHRRGPYGVTRWTAEIERWLSAASLTSEEEWYAGRPLLVTANDYELQLFNGDTGVVVASPEHGTTAAFHRAGEPLLLSPHRLSAVQTVHAMTVHRAQGSQFQRVTLLLPAADSPLLTRELFYTAITRAQAHVRVVGTAEAVRRAVLRPIVRASGLRRAADA